MVPLASDIRTEDVLCPPPDTLPMGGMGISGQGRRHGAVGITKYTEVQTVAQQRLMNLAPPMRRLGDQGFAETLTASLRLLKKGGWR